MSFSSVYGWGWLLPLQATANPQREGHALSRPLATELSVEVVVAHLEGVMDTTAQAAENPDFVGVQMTTCRIAVTASITDVSADTSPDVSFDADASPDSIYLYQEQALFRNVAEPYRQRFLHILPGDHHRIDSRR